MMPDSACLYLHGFLSSPQSRKAQQLIEYFQQHFSAQQLSIPTLPFEPAAAIVVAEQALFELQQRFKQVFIIGSSLGGYYATYLSQKYGVKAALINPAVRPFDLFADYLGPQQHYYDGNTYELKLEHIAQLQEFDCPIIQQPNLLFLLLQTADETLDYRQAAQLYQSCKGWYEGGGNHSFTDFLERLPMLFAFVTNS